MSKGQFSASPKPKFLQNLIDSNDVNLRTPDLSPHPIRNKQTDRLKINYNHHSGLYSPSPQTPTRALQHHNLNSDEFMAAFNSPNLSPIKDKIF